MTHFVRGRRASSGPSMVSALASGLVLLALSITGCSADDEPTDAPASYSTFIPQACVPKAAMLEPEPVTDPDNVALAAVNAAPPPAGSVTMYWRYLPADPSAGTPASVGLTLCSPELPDSVARSFATSLARSLAASAVGVDVGTVNVTFAFPDSTTTQGTEYAIDDFADHDWAGDDAAELDAAWTERRAPAPTTT